MKKFAFFIATWLCFANSQAQQITEKHLSFSGKENLNLNVQIADSIDIQTWNKDEVYLKASVNINENKDNEAYLISFNETGNTIEVKANFKKDYFKGKDGSCCESDIRWKLMVPEKIHFSLETINGNITIAGDTRGMNVKSISGFIDLAVPETRQADVELSTISGTVYSNHALVLKEMNKSSHSIIKEQLNNGGPLIKLETISGDIFFRKSI
jgi:hypothetical protein